MAYSKAISDGADVIDCPVQMSQDGVPFCLGSINLMNNTQIGQTQFRTLVQNVNELQPSQGIFSFSVNWADIQGLTRKWVLICSSKLVLFNLSDGDSLSPVSLFACGVWRPLVSNYQTLITYSFSLPCCSCHLQPMDGLFVVQES